MKISPVYSYNSKGQKQVSAFRTTFSKIEAEKNGIKVGDEVRIKFEKNKIIIEKD